MEYLDYFDSEENYLGKEERGLVHKNGLWHYHVGVWVMNKEGKILLQQRSKGKLINPLKWSRTGGHVDAGETPEMGIHRELLEEVGLDVKPEDFELINKEKEDVYDKEHDLQHRNFVYNYFVMLDFKIEDCKLQKEEVEQVKMITIEELEDIYARKDDNYTISRWKSIDGIVKYLKEKRENLLKGNS